MNTKTLYLECYSGISGDMTVAALIDLGVDEEILMAGLSSLKVQGYTVNISKTTKCGIVATKFDVLLDQHNHENETHGHTHHSHSHEHFHRNLHDIKKIIFQSQITERAKSIANNIFAVVAEAEAKVHGKNIDEVHFHEVGAIDSIVDIVATAICIDYLNIKDVIISPIYEGTGHVKCQHGIIPVPVPAVTEIVSRHGLQLKITDNSGEMITPTGAAIAAALKSKENLPEGCKYQKIGMGAGTKDFPKANILRAFLMEAPGEAEIGQEKAAGTVPSASKEEDAIVVLECNIDDMTGEEFGFALEVLFEEGVLDAYFTPIFMKKNRPAYMLSVICKQQDLTRIKELIFKFTSTLGIRISNHTRCIMERSIGYFQSSLGQVRIKEARHGSIRKETVEYEDVRKIAKESNRSISEVYKTVYGELGLSSRAIPLESKDGVQKDC